MPFSDTVYDAVRLAYLNLRAMLRVGRVAFKHPSGTPFPKPLPEGIEVILTVSASPTDEEIFVIEGDGLPLVGHGMALRTFPSFDEMAKFVHLKGTEWEDK